MKKPRYLDGVIECENMWNSGSSVQALYDYLNEESRITSGDHRWSDWLNGFHDCLVFKIKNSVVRH